jgi:hypothetical protein
MTSSAFGKRKEIPYTGSFDTEVTSIAVPTQPHYPEGDCKVSGEKGKYKFRFIYNLK